LTAKAVAINSEHKRETDLRCGKHGTRPKVTTNAFSTGRQRFFQTKVNNMGSAANASNWK